MEKTDLHTDYAWDCPHCEVHYTTRKDVWESFEHTCGACGNTYLVEN